MTVTSLLNSKSMNDEDVCRFVGITAAELSMARKVEAMQAAPDPIAMMMQMADNITVGDKSQKKETRSVSELRAAKSMGKKEVSQMSREAFDKMEQSGRFPAKMMEVIKKGQRWYKMEQKQLAAQKKKGGKGAGMAESKAALHS